MGPRPWLLTQFGLIEVVKNGRMVIGQAKFQALPQSNNGPQNP